GDEAGRPAYVVLFFSSRRRHTRFSRDWSSDVCSSDLGSRLPKTVIGSHFRGANSPSKFDHAVGSSKVFDTPPPQEEGKLMQTCEIGRASCRERGEIRGRGAGRTQEAHRQ